MDGGGEQRSWAAAGTNARCGPSGAGVRGGRADGSPDFYWGLEPAEGAIGRGSIRMYCPSVQGL